MAHFLQFFLDLATAPSEMGFSRQGSSSLGIGGAEHGAKARKLATTILPLMLSHLLTGVSLNTDK
jgi:hypothetical protein